MTKTGFVMLVMWMALMVVFLTVGAMALPDKAETETYPTPYVIVTQMCDDDSRAELTREYRKIKRWDERGARIFRDGVRDDPSCPNIR